MIEIQENSNYVTGSEGGTIWETAATIAVVFVTIETVVADTAIILVSGKATRG